MLVGAVPPEFAGETAVGGAGFWYAVAGGAVISCATALAALTMAHERRRGTVAWMAARAVPRASVLFSWFLGFAILLILGLTLGSVGAWLAAIGRSETTPDAIPFGAAVGATAATALAGVAVGLLIGTLLPTRPATFLALAVSAALVASPSCAAERHPAAARGRHPHPPDSMARPVAGALESAGASLAAAAVLLVLAAAGLERSDL
jgi:hypothetical protein